jgi:hypothetical protein|tara:strand:+ start:7290 stop:7592 length:303 start_codon:yes stop_codon:yes gene_type:complete
MPQVTASLFNNQNEAMTHANSVIGSLDLQDVLNPKRLVQVVHPNQVHSSETMWLVIEPQNLEGLVAKRNAIRAEAMQKLAKLEDQVASLRSAHGFLGSEE